MRLATLARVLASSVLAGCGSSPPAVLPVGSPIPTSTPIAVVDEPAHDEPIDAGVAIDAAPPPAPLADATRWIAVTTGDVAATLVKLPPGYVGAIVDLGPRVVALHGPAVHELCPRHEDSCKPWVDEEHPIGFVTAKRRIVRRAWKDYAKQLAAREQQFGEMREPIAVVLRGLVTGYHVGRPAWFSTGPSRGPLRDHGFPHELEMRLADLPRGAVDVEAELPLDLVLSLSDVEVRIKRLGEHLYFPPSKQLPPVERAIAEAADAKVSVSGLGPMKFVVVRQLASGHLVTFFADTPCGRHVVDQAAFVVGVGPGAFVHASQPWTKPCLNKGGRRPPGYLARTDAVDGDLASALGELAELEAASVVAFERLAAELAGLGAPASLPARARGAAADERRHAAIVAELAGTPVGDLVLEEVGTRDAFAIALDNAVVGCVEEAFSAVVCAYQARAAVDPRVAAAMELIADDEARHGELAWDIAAWLEPRLPPDQRARVRAARSAALARLHAGPLAASSHVARALGLPPADHARVLADGFAAYAAARLA